MSFSALFMFGCGVLLTFAPTELAGAAGGSQMPLLVPLAQTCGALYLGFALLNWMAKDHLIGGIYSRPVAMGNFLHFSVVAMALVKGLAGLPRSAGTFALLFLYVFLAILLWVCSVPASEERLNSSREVTCSKVHVEG